MDTNSRMQIADKAMKSFIARYFRDDEDGTGMITGEFYWPRAEIMEVVMDAWDKTQALFQVITIIHRAIFAKKLLHFPVINCNRTIQIALIFSDLI